MDKEHKKALELFQSDYNRRLEESFAQVLSENENVRLFFINEDEAFTDGQNIVVDPAVRNAFADVHALKRTEDYMKLSNLISSDPWYALKIITRGQTIHECLHILYTNFPSGVTNDARSSTNVRRATLALIFNIIEDAFIEAAGCSVFDNLEFFLLFERLATLFSNAPAQGTVQRTFSEEVANCESAKIEPLTEYLEYMGCFLLYPMVILDEAPTEIAEYVNKTKQLFLDGSVCGDPDKRFGYSQQVFDIIEPIIPESEKDINIKRLLKMLPGAKTHTGDSMAITTILSKGRKAKVNRRLFTSLDGAPLKIRDFNDQLNAILLTYENDKQATMEQTPKQPVIIKWNGTQFDCHSIHNNIELIETKPSPNLHLRRAYQNIYNKYRININTYNSRFAQLLKANVSVRDEKQLFGAGISSKNLADVKKRYWYRNTEELGVPDLAVLLLIDGSGSMAGDRRDSAMVASVILHEVLKAQGIAHAIVEHRALYGKPVVKHNILIDFNSRDDDKLNILALNANEGTREGLSLYWAERFIAKKSACDRRLIIVISDGVPAHDDGGNYLYYPPVSIRDTANAAAKIIKRGTNIIAVALDDEDEGNCYDALSEIYPHVISCTELEHLTGQLLGIISKHLT